MVPPPPVHPAIPWHRRLEARVLLSATVIAGLALVAVLMATSRVVNRFSVTRSRNDLIAAREAFGRIIDSHAEYAARETRLIVELPIFRASLTDKRLASDGPTIDDMAADYCRKLEAHFCVVTDAGGTWIGRAGWPASGQQASIVAGPIQATRSGQSFKDFVTIADELFLIVSEPAVFGQEVIGTFTAGYRLSDGVAGELSLVARSDVTFVCGSNRLCGSSLPADDRAALKSTLERDPVQFADTDAEPILRSIGGTSYVGGAFALRSGTPSAGAPDAPRLILLQNVSSTELALNAIHTALVKVGLVTFGVAVIGILFLTRRVTRPLRHLVTVANEVAAGNWTRRVPAIGPAEARTMASAFNHMTVTLSHWHQAAKERAQQLHESSERFRSITNTANDAIISINNQGEIVFWNLRAQTVFGYEERDAVGLAIVKLVPDRYLAEFKDQITKLCTGDESWLGKTVELSALRKDGNEVPIELSLSTWKAGDAVFYTGVIRDITERKLAAEALRQREEELRHAQKMEAVGRLAGGIAHDFNNLLTAILGYADLLLEELPGDDAIRPDVEGIQKAGRSAASLTKELLAFSRKQVLQPVVLDMNEVVSSTEILLRRLLGEDVELILQLETYPEPVKADRSQLEQVLLNLVVNARDAMPSGGRLTIATSNVDFDGAAGDGNRPVAIGQHVALTVSDTGHGMTEEVRSHIFEPFFTTKELGKGTGLGLATVYGIVQQSGGHIWVESEPGQGSSFHVCLPALDLAELKHEDRPAPGHQAQGGSETVLLVEDNEAVRNLARDALKRYGYQVIEAENGQEALQVAASQLERISLVLTDVVMPVMGGRELAKQLLARRRDLKIIFTSGYTNDAILSQTGLGGAAAFLQKPFTPALLGQTVRDVLDTTTAA